MRRSVKVALRALMIALAVTVPITGVLIHGLTRDPRAIPSPLVGRPAPTIVLRLFDGGALDTKTLRGRVVVVQLLGLLVLPGLL